MNVTQDLSILHLILDASAVVQIVMALLLLVSVMSWHYIFRKSFAIRKARAQTEEFERAFWSGGSLQSLYQQVGGNAGSGAMERIFGIWRLIHRFAETLPKQDSGIRDGALPTRDVERMRRALTFIEAHYADRMTLADIAESMSLSEGECCRVFRRMLRSTPMEYAISCRIRESLSLLAAGRLSVTEIALRTGFSGSSYFTETFRKVMGMTPSEYRRQTGAE